MADRRIYKHGHKKIRTINNFNEIKNGEKDEIFEMHKSATPKRNSKYDKYEEGIKDINGVEYVYEDVVKKQLEQK